jgi:glycosyltransferase involved in cell wall biosynthesis
MPSGISVIICCYNSASRIAPTLQHLVAQKNMPPSAWEVILIDNASTDDTAEKASRFWEALEVEKPAFKILAELKPGLSAARKKGIESSCFDYVLFCDDDNWLDENYLSISLDIMKANQCIGALGGTGHPVFEGKEPPYFWINQYHALAVGIQSGKEGDITEERGVLYGAGMIINKGAFRILREKFGFQFLLSGRVGSNLVSSEDHELCLAMRKIGYRIFYSKDLKFEHFIPAFRTTIQYYKRLFTGFGMSYALLHPYRVNEGNLDDFKNDYRYLCARCLKNMVVLSIQLFFTGYPFSKDKYRYLDQIHQLYLNKGMLYIFLKVKNKFKQQYAECSIFAMNANNNL